MKNFVIILNSTIFMVLFCFSDIYSLPLTRSCYTPPEDTIDMALKEEFIYINSMNRKDNYSFNLGIPGNTSVGLDFSLIHYTPFEAGEGVPGDILFNIWHFAGDFFDGKLDGGFSAVFVLPTGPDAYTDENCRNLSFGNNEFKFNPVLSYELTGKENIIFNLSYTFREGRNEDFYSGFSFNPLKSETYKSCMGLNPFYKGAFLEGERLKNDYSSIAIGLITSRIYPWVFFTEIYYSTGNYRGFNSSNSLNIEGDGVNPLLYSAGVKFFISKSFFIQAADVVDLLMNNDYIKNRVEFTLNIFF